MHLTDGLSINDVIKLVDFLYRRVGRSHLEPHPGRFTNCLERVKGVTKTMTFTP